MLNQHHLSISAYCRYSAALITPYHIESSTNSDCMRRSPPHAQLSHYSRALQLQLAASSHAGLRSHVHTDCNCHTGACRMRLISGQSYQHTCRHLTRHYHVTAAPIRATYHALLCASKTDASVRVNSSRTTLKTRRAVDVVLITIT